TYIHILYTYGTVYKTSPFPIDSAVNTAKFSFFFSSRRRHTRFSRDWSSDVCSSDLERGDLVAAAGPRGGRLGTLTPGATAPAPRSEERRVGKECRSRGSADH